MSKSKDITSRDSWSNDPDVTWVYYYTSHREKLISFFPININERGCFFVLFLAWAAAAAAFIILLTFPLWWKCFPGLIILYFLRYRLKTAAFAFFFFFCPPAMFLKDNFWKIIKFFFPHFAIGQMTTRRHNYIYIGRAWKRSGAGATRSTGWWRARWVGWSSASSSSASIARRTSSSGWPARISKRTTIPKWSKRRPGSSTRTTSPSYRPKRYVYCTHYYYKQHDSIHHFWLDTYTQPLLSAAINVSRPVSGNGLYTS